MLPSLETFALKDFNGFLKHMHRCQLSQDILFWYTSSILFRFFAYLKPYSFLPV